MDDLTIDKALEDWEFKPNKVSVREVKVDQRIVLQLRVDLGVLQMETNGRPDGTRPFDSDSVLDWIQSRELLDDEREFKFDTDECIEVDREFAQFYHRRICWMELKQFRNAIADADHTLSLMDACLRHSPGQQWTISHEQHRPFVIFHRTQAAALAEVEDGDNGEKAIEEINKGLEQIEEFYQKYEIDGEFEDDELAKWLVDIREDLRERFDVGATLQEQLADAIENEKYELAARLRDQLKKRR